MQRPLFLTALLTSACMSQPFTDDALLQEWPEPVSLDDAIPGQWIVAVEGGGHPADSALAAGAGRWSARTVGRRVVWRRACAPR